MTNVELEKFISSHEMNRLELKESFGVECIEAACTFAKLKSALKEFYKIPENIGVDEAFEKMSALKSALKNAQKVIELIRDCDGATVETIAKRIGKSRRYVLNITKVLVRAQMLRRVGGRKLGHWEVLK